MAFEFTIDKLEHHGRTHRVLTALPTRPWVECGQGETQQSREMQAVLLERVAANPKVGAVVLRTRNAQGESMWHLDAADPDDLPRVAQLAILDQLALWTACMELGVYAVCLTDLADQASTMRRAAGLVRERFAARRTRQERINEWVSARLVHYIGSSYERAWTGQIPSTLSLLRVHGERAMERLHGAPTLARNQRLDPPETFGAHLHA